MTTEEIIALLRQQYAGGIGQGTAEVDQNGNPTGFIDFGGGLRMQQQRVGGMADDGTQALGNYIGALTGEQVNPETGKQGGYLGTFGQDGQLAGIDWKDTPQSGWFKQNMSTWGPMAVLGAAAAGGGLFGGGAGGSTASAAPLEAGLADVGSSWVGGSVAPGFAGGAAGGGAGAAAAGAGSSLLNPNNAALVGSLAGGLGGSTTPPAAPPQADPQAAIDANVAKINALFGDREPLYQQLYKDNYGLQSSRLNESREDTLRKLRFGAARTGLTAGSADISAKGTEQRNFGRALMDASNASQGSVDQARANDERTRLNLIGQMRTGLGAADATQSALASMQDNLTSARNDQRFSAVDNYAGAMAPVVGNYQIQQGRQQARSAYPNRTAGSYTGTISR